MKEQYIYPQNLRSRAKLWLWSLRDLAVGGIGLLLSVLALTQLGAVLPIALTLTYAFLSIRPDEESVLDFIRLGIRYFVTGQQFYVWRPDDAGRRDREK